MSNNCVKLRINPCFGKTPLKYQTENQNQSFVRNSVKNRPKVNKIWECVYSFHKMLPFYVCILETVFHEKKFVPDTDGTTY